MQVCKSASMSIVAALAVMTNVGAALAASKCDIVGTFVDTLGSVGEFSSEKRGKATNDTACQTAYRLTVTKLTETVLNFKGKAKQCPAINAKFTFVAGSCLVANGTLTVKGVGSFNDTITITGEAARFKPVDSSALTNGFK